MRPILALAILLLGLGAAAPEPKPQESVTAADPSALFEIALAPIKADSEFIVADPPEWSDPAHEQGEEAREPPPAPAPASTDLQSVEAPAPALDDLCHALLAAADDNNLPVAFFANLIWQESRLRNDAVSPVGALGIAQFMPRVAVAAGVGNPFDPHQAIPASARLLHTLREHFRNLGFVAAAYNAGAHRVGEWLDRGRTLPRQTRTYVLRVTGQSVEQWRKAPLGDGQLTFIRRLPCRELPAFADLEQAQLQEAQSAPPQQEEARAAPAKPERAAAPRAAAAFDRARHRAAISGHLHPHLQQHTRQTAIRVAAHNFRAKHQGGRPQHVGHEKRRIAENASVPSSGGRAAQAARPMAIRTAGTANIA